MATPNFLMKLVPWALALGLAVLLGPTSATWADDSADLSQVVQQHSPSIVTIKYVMKMNLGGRGGLGDQESESEVAGVVIDPAGIVLCSNTQLGGLGGMMSRMLGNMPGFEMSSSVTNVKVLVGPEEEELDAKVLARDPELDLAWVEIAPSDRQFAAVDLSQSVEPGLGQAVVSLRRLGKYFDRAPAVHEFAIGGQTEKPRKLWIPQAVLQSGLGMPVFTLDGKVVGVVILQMPTADDLGGAAGNPMAMLGSLFSMQDNAGGMILPAESVIKATQRARQAGSGDVDDAAGGL